MISRMDDRELRSIFEGVDFEDQETNAFFKEKFEKAGIKVRKNIHRGYVSHQYSMKHFPDVYKNNPEMMRCSFGKWHYFYYKDEKRISLVYLPGYGIPFPNVWEICSGGTCSNCVDAEERFRSRKQAEERIYELLTDLT